MATLTLSPRPAADAQLVPGVALCLLLAALALAGMASDPRLLDGWSVWTKPLKFAVSAGLHLATLAVFAALLSPRVRAGRVLAVTVAVALVCAVGELAYIFVQAGRQAHSHFNLATPVEAAMFSAMGVGAVLLTGTAAAIGWLIARDREARVSPGLRRGAVLGLTLGTGLTIVVAGYLGGNGGHHVGLHPEGGAVAPLFGWSLETGDLRPAHFLALHMMQAVPLIGWAADRWAPGQAAALATAGAAAWVVLTLALFAQALAGLPLI